MPAVLITQCLQRDFVDPIGPHDALPNLLHVGHAESTRLLGPDPKAGPVAQLMSWAHGLPAEELQIIHIRDWHDPDDPRQRAHLEKFGAHCLQGSPGARLVLGMDEAVARAANECTVDSPGLNDFAGTELEARLRRIQADGDDELRIGVVGVWTEAKVSFLLYELKTRLGIDRLATCTALTASASRSQHFNALTQLHKILGVDCFESLTEFAQWLRPGASLPLPTQRSGFDPDLTVGHGPALSADDRSIVGHLFRDSTAVELEPLTGGFSGTLVYRATAQDAMGHRQSPSVVKLGPNRLIAQERVAFERVEEILGNNAPRVRGFADLGDRAGLKYSYAAMGQGGVQTLKALVESGASTSRLESVLRCTLSEILGPFYAAARYERLPIFEHYGFSSHWTATVRAAVGALTAQANEPVLEFPGGLRLPNVCDFYERFLGEAPLPDTDHHYVCYVHGDLNTANILIDARNNVWVIDFFHAAPGHVLKDVAKLENDLLFLLTTVTDESQLRQGLAISTALRSVTDLRAELPDRPADLRSDQMRRAWDLLGTLRQIGGQLCREDRDPLQLRVALLRYAVHTLGFPEAGELQRRWALASACMLAEDVAASVRADRRLRADWFPPTVTGASGRLGITLCPGRRDRGRDLEADLADLGDAGVTDLVCLLSDAELGWAGVSDLPGRAAAHGIRYRRLPIPDQGVPTAGDADTVVRWCREALADDRRVVLTCMGGLGRSGTIAACILVSLGLAADRAVAEVRAVRGPRAIETLQQEAFVTAFTADRCAAQP